MVNGDAADTESLIKNEWTQQGEDENANTQQAQTGASLREEKTQTKTKTRLNAFLTVTDDFISLFVFFPLVCLYWRGTYGLQDVYFAPEDLTTSYWISFGIGANLCLLAYLVQPWLSSLLRPRKLSAEPICSTGAFELGGVSYFVLTRVYLYAHSWAVMCYWRGVWEFFDLYLGTGWFNSLILYLCAQLIVLSTLTVRSVSGAPLSIQLDTDDNLLHPLTVFRVNSQQTYKYAADALFTLFGVLTCIIVIWRSIWNICDYVLLPENPLESDVVSLALGYLLMLLLLAFQPLFSHTSAALDRLPACYKIVFEDLVMIVATWCNVLLWMGGWNLCLQYVIPEPVLGSWVCHIVGTVSLISLQVFSAVAFNGIDRDGIYKNGSGIFPTKYLRIYCQQKRRQEIQSEVDEELLDTTLVNTTLVDTTLVESQESEDSAESALLADHVT